MANTLGVTVTYEKIVANVYRHDVFSEMRLGTSVNKLGLKFHSSRVKSVAPSPGMNIHGK